MCFFKVDGVVKIGLFNRLIILFFGCCLIASQGSSALAESKTIHLSKPQVMASYRSRPVALKNGGRLMLVSPREWFWLAEKLSIQLQKAHAHYTKLFGPIPPVETTLKLIDAGVFYRETGAPSWTNALYYKGVMSIPLNFEEPVDMDELFRSVSHEYTHAVINALSAGRTPGWLDEGLAQEAEGDVNPALEPSLKKWLFFNAPISLDLLQGGFTKLENRMVAPAYGQSLYAARVVVNTFGFENLRSYFDNLRAGKPKPEAFRAAFGISEAGFEEAFGKYVKRWAYGGNNKVEVVKHSPSDVKRKNSDPIRGELGR